MQNSKNPVLFLYFNDGPVPMKQAWWIWVNRLYETIMNVYDHNKTKNPTKLCMFHGMYVWNNLEWVRIPDCYVES